jgi:4a-hydroxytetrahydrobiopterin dehydratase
LADKLTKEERMAALSKLPEWKIVEGREAIYRQFKFPNFNAAFAFMTKVAMLAEKMDHHPEWSNVYNRVEVILTTHDAKGITALDVKMAEFMDANAA